MLMSSRSASCVYNVQKNKSPMCIYVMISVFCLKSLDSGCEMRRDSKGNVVCLLNLIYSYVYTLMYRENGTTYAIPTLRALLSDNVDQMKTMTWMSSTGTCGSLLLDVLTALLACEHKGWVGQVNIAMLVQFSYLLLPEACICA